jgi:hypothetical protein
MMLTIIAVLCYSLICMVFALSACQVARSDMD